MRKHCNVFFVCFLSFLLSASGCVLQTITKQQYSSRPTVFFDIESYSSFSYIEHNLLNVLKNIFTEHGYRFSSECTALYILKVIIKKIDTIETIVSCDNIVYGNYKQISGQLIIKNRDAVLYNKPFVFEGFVNESEDFLWKERYEVAGLCTIYDIMAVRIESFLYALL
ncbi:hypothetical protein JKY79_00970 [Candidatus Babeliales bacterium]|nr:hypothetical protein [Candidatus Babeliales bacterium]